MPHTIQWAAASGARLSLLCLPHAGGDATAFRSWPHHLADVARVGVAELPGRGHFFGLPAVRRIVDQVEWLLPEVSRIDSPFVLFGYSMGALLALELAHALRDAQSPAPLLVMLAAHAPPDCRTGDEKLHALADPEFVERLAEFDGMPAEVLQHRELLQLIAPRLRADLEACETYAPASRTALDVPLVVYGGVADREVPHPLLLHWARHSRARLECVLLPGRHFFLQTALPALIADVRARLGAVALS